MEEVGNYRPAEMEKEILDFWERERIFEKSLKQREGSKPFIFLEGPPTANGTPHPGHVLTRIMKDVVLRYYTMLGYHVPRRAGWDTHGLPVEIEVEKKLGLKSKQDIERYGVKRFNEECRKSTFQYEHEWVEMTRRVGFWIDMENPYITLDNEYIESVWWSLKRLWEKGYLYKGYKVVPYCPRCGTALSAHEVAQGYKSVTEPSIFVKFKVKREDASFLAWTTTPWTLLSNVALAVHPDEPYLKIRYRDEILILAEERVARLFKGEEYEILDRFMGRELEGKEYEPLFTYEKPDKKAWYVICADFVTMDEGTGIVHIAPAFGEEDYEAGKEYDLPVIQLVKKDGTFDDKVEPWKGMFVKDADPLIIEHLKERGLIFAVQDYTHDYPFCWRCDTPLLYYAMESWFIAVSKFRKQLLENNEAVEWYPSHVKHGRFGDFISEAKDWALSRDRYWGTPLPIWICEKCGNEICIGSVDELRNLSKEFPESYDLHKPFVDEIEVRCPRCNARMKREPYVIDCWYDSGSAFFAQWHYPFENKEMFDECFPVDFICEALDQTRGWFYSLMAISTLLFNSPPYRRVLTLGLVLDKEGQKMSKSKKNYLDPNYIFEREGADAMRWYFLSANAPWMPIRFYEDAIKEVLGRFIMTLWNSFRFYISYAKLDGFDPRKKYVHLDERKGIDRWVMSRLHATVREVRKSMEGFEIHKATRSIESFVIDDLSNWYIRRSRKRLWVEEENEDKLSCYSTLHDVFLTLSRLLAPFVPFIAEAIYQRMRYEGMKESVHLCDYPDFDEGCLDEGLEDAMEKVREIADIGRSLRGKVGIKIRYPLRELIVVCEEDVERKVKGFVDLLREEINVKKVSFSRREGHKMEPSRYIMEKRDDMKVILDIELTDDLLAEGLSREIVRRIQAMRKEMDLEIEDRIRTEISIEESKIKLLKEWIDYIAGETRSVSVDFKESPKGELVKKWRIGDTEVTIGIEKVKDSEL